MVKVKKPVQPEQSTLITAVKNVKQKLLTKQLKKAEIKIAPESVPPPKKEEVTLNRGIVYLGHIPHGFFESQMHSYFKQFGRVTRVRLARSKKTGRSRGYGYVEFEHSEVAEIAAQSMNNYLMSGRLLKATYIPPEKQHGRFFSGRQWSKQNYPRLVNRAQQNLHKNKNVDNKIEAALLKRGLSKLSNIEKKLEEAGVVYKIEPVDVPVSSAIKRKAGFGLPSGEAKKRKIASGESKTGKTKKEITVAEGSGKKIKKKDASKEVAVKQNKTKVESKVMVAEKKGEQPKSDTSAAPKSKKKAKAAAPLAKPAVQTPESQVAKKSKKKTVAGEKITEELMEKVANQVLSGKRLKKKGAAAVLLPEEKLNQNKTTAVIPVTEKAKKKKPSAASPVIEKSMQKKNTFAVPSLKKSKQKVGPPISQNKKAKNAKKSVAA